jgi:hypothetical protein
MITVQNLINHGRGSALDIVVDAGPISSRSGFRRSVPSGHVEFIPPGGQADVSMSIVLDEYKVATQSTPPKLSDAISYLDFDIKFSDIEYRRHVVRYKFVIGRNERLSDWLIRVEGIDHKIQRARIPHCRALWRKIQSYIKSLFKRANN